MTSMKKNLLSAAACALMGLASSAQAGVIIDLFSDPAVPQEVIATKKNENASNQVGSFPSILGGYRDLSVTMVDGPSTYQGLSYVSSVTVGNGSLAFANGATITGKAVVTWDGINEAGADGGGVTKTGLGGLDLTYGGAANKFLVDVFSTDLGFNYSISLWDMDGTQSTLSAGVQFQVNSKITTDYYFDWFNLGTGLYCNGIAITDPLTCADPTTQLLFSIVRTGDGVDFSKIGAVQLTLQGDRAELDMRIGSIRTVPEPATLGLVGLALLGAGAISRRSARKS